MINNLESHLFRLNSRKCLLSFLFALFAMIFIHSPLQAEEDRFALEPAFENLFDGAGTKEAVSKKKLNESNTAAELNTQVLKSDSLKLSAAQTQSLTKKNSEAEKTQAPGPALQTESMNPQGSVIPQAAEKSVNKKDAVTPDIIKRETPAFEVLKKEINDGSVKPLSDSGKAVIHHAEVKPPAKSVSSAVVKAPVLKGAVPLQEVADLKNKPEKTVVAAMLGPSAAKLTTVDQKRDLNSIQPIRDSKPLAGAAIDHPTIVSGSKPNSPAKPSQDQLKEISREVTQPKSDFSEKKPVFISKPVMDSSPRLVETERSVAKSEAQAVSADSSDNTNSFVQTPLNAAVSLTPQSAKIPVCETTKSGNASGTLVITNERESAGAFDSDDSSSALRHQNTKSHAWLYWIVAGAMGFIIILGGIFINQKTGGSTMFKNMKLGVKIGGGFAIVLILTAVVAYIGFSSLTGVVDRVMKADEMNQLVVQILQMRHHGKDYIINEDAKFLDKMNQAVVTFKKDAIVLKDELTVAADKSRMDEIVTGVERYFDNFNKYVASMGKEKELALSWRKVGVDVMGGTEKAVLEVIGPKIEAAQRSNDMSSYMKYSNADKLLSNEIVEGFMGVRIAAIYFIMKKTDGEWDKLQAELKKLDEGINKFDQSVRGDKDLGGLAASIRQSIAEYAVTGKQYYDLFAHQRILNDQMLVAASAAVKACDEGKKDQEGRMKSQIAVANTAMLLGALFAILIGILLAVVITIGITRPINRIIAELNAGSEQTSAAAGQVSGASQQLSQGATEQAASLEETSSSLDQMASMTKQNADNASKANQLAQEARTSADQGGQAMGEMSTAITAINESSDKISKILKTIEEIAFQTNLLALNAAVEAARAGEHGKGFAVVAEEVRNLAKRSATAAKDTADLIEDNMAKAKQGTEIAGKAGESLKAIMNNSAKVADIIAEIAAASKEQAEGIGQITKAVSQMDQVTQQNAAAAEESASASEELASQAEALKGMVHELESMVEGAAAKALVATSSVHRATERRTAHGVTTKLNPHGLTSVKADLKKAKVAEGTAKKAPKVSRPEQVIPLDESEEAGL